ncbi:MAG: hypothetical protein JSU68_07870 [Phycisphaerales bacterium]|nr:MAG: hypothetical protein JSU68_07870 [Phycisphaerales bacterium]
MDDVKTCQGCGASIYQEHLDRGMAGFVAGKLLCNVCRNQTLGGPSAPSPGSSGSMPSAVDPSEETIRLVDDAEVSASVSPGGSMMGDTRVPIGRAASDLVLTRAMVKGANATRCRTFHAKLSEGALSYMDEQFNEWCDRNPEIEVKFATQTVGIFEGKHSAEQHLILTVFY